jgi:cobalt-zinc-cadmium efflux system membrane fusion protein
MSSRTKGAAAVAVIAVIALATYLFYGRGAASGEDPAEKLRVEGNAVRLDSDAPQWAYIGLETAEEAPILPPLPAPGRVLFDEKRTSNVGSPLAGRVETVTVRVGDQVKQGDKLFSVRSGDFADLDHAIASAREEVEVKRRVYERQKDLLALKAVAEKDVDLAQSELKQAELSLHGANAKESSLSVAHGGDNLFWVRAPRNGTVVELLVFSSQQVSPDSATPLLRVSDLAEVLVIAEVPEVDAMDIKDGEAVDVVSRDGSITREGTVAHVSEVIDPQRQTVEVRVRVPNADHVMRPNAFVEVQLKPDTTLQRVQVKEDAVVLAGERSVVFVESAPGKLERIPVVTGRRRDHKVELRSGITPGTKYVARGALLLLNQVDLAN